MYGFVTRGKVWQYPDFVRLFHPSTPLRSAELSKEWQKTNIMMRRWNHNVILFRGNSCFLSAVCRRSFSGQSGDRTCLVLYKRLVVCFAWPFQLLPSACADNPLTVKISWKFSGKFLFTRGKVWQCPDFVRLIHISTHLRSVEAGSLRWRKAGEKFKKASFRYLLLLTSSQRNEPNNVSWLPFNVFRGLKQNFIQEKSQKKKIRTRDKKNSITSCEIGNLSKSLTS